MSHEEIAIELIRHTIKGTEWDNQVLLAGGYVRDEILGRPPKDIDIIVTRENGGIEFANWIVNRLRPVASKTVVTFPRFGTAKFSLWVGTNARDRREIHIEAVMP